MIVNHQSIFFKSLENFSFVENILARLTHIPKLYLLKGLKIFFLLTKTMSNYPQIRNTLWVIHQYGRNHFSDKRNDLFCVGKVVAAWQIRTSPIQSNYGIWRRSKHGKCLFRVYQWNTQLILWYQTISASDSEIFLSNLLHYLPHTCSLVRHHLNTLRSQ